VDLPLAREVVLFLLVFARVGTAVMLLPGWGDGGVPVRVRLAMALSLSAVMVPVVEGSYGGVEDDRVLVPLLLGELGIGLLLGLAVRTLVAALHLGGSMVALNSGFAAASLFDPREGTQGTVLSAFFAVAGTTALFAAGFDRLLVVLLAESWRLLPPGHLPVSPSLEALAALGSAMWRTALALAAPVLAVSFVTQLGAGLVNRLVPGIQVFFVILPAQLLLTLGALALSLAMAVAVFVRAVPADLDILAR